MLCLVYLFDFSRHKNVWKKQWGDFQTVLFQSKFLQNFLKQIPHDKFYELLNYILFFHYTLSVFGKNMFYKNIEVQICEFLRIF